MHRCGTREPGRLRGLRDRRFRSIITRCAAKPLCLPVVLHSTILVPDSITVAVVDSEHVRVELEDLGPMARADAKHAVHDGLLLSIGPSDPALNFARRWRRIGVGLLPGAAVRGGAEGPLRLHSWRIYDGVGWKSGLERVLIISIAQNELAGDARHSPGGRAEAMRNPGRRRREIGRAHV